MAFKESEHPRDKDGKFTDGKNVSEGQTAEEIAKEIFPHLTEDGERDIIKLPDETLPRSVGAKWINHEIALPDGNVAKFVEGSKLQNKEVFAGKGCKRKIDQVSDLVRNYGGSAEEWRKVKAVATIALPNGDIERVEVHWYEEPSVGKVRFKVK